MFWKQIEPHDHEKGSLAPWVSKETFITFILLVKMYIGLSGGGCKSSQET